MRNEIREHTEDNVRRRALQIFSDAYPSLPEDVEEIIAFVEQQEHLDSVGKQKMYDAIREVYGWSKAHYSGAENLIVLPSLRFG